MDFTLNFLPPGGLASSVVTTVWVGVMVVVFFNLRFGTTLSGLVVPGYLIPLFLVHPVSGFVILGESVVTYLLARLLAERMLVRVGLGEMFGRDRFFALILTSVLVRVASDGFLLPMLADYLAQIGAPYELRSGLHSFGLIIIALCANQFWNGGLRVGAATLAVYLVTTYLLVSEVLVPLTNFNISTLSYMYEDIAASILASPKAYIILITAAYVASRMNLRYGWDFNGILIPSLLALQWYDPVKIVATFAEAFVIYAGAVALLRTPMMANLNMEGARQLLLFFNVGFVYKLLLGYAIIYFFPALKVTDYYGFGYVLGTLMALKMYQKGILIRFTRTTLQTSLVATFIASVLGFSLTIYQGDPVAVAAGAVQRNTIVIEQDKLSVVVARLRTASYQSEQAETPQLPEADQLQAFKQLFVRMGQVGQPMDEERLVEVDIRAQALGYQLSIIEQRYLALHDATPERGWGFFVIDTASASSLAVQVPRALDEPKVAAVADRVFSGLEARWLAYSGARAHRAKDGSDDALNNARSLMQQFHQTVANNNALQLRSFTRASARKLLGMRKDDQGIDLAIAQSALYIKRRLPPGLTLTTLQALVGDYQIHWRAPVLQNRQRDTAINGFAELFINDPGLLSVYSYAGSGLPVTRIEQSRRIDGYLQNYLHSGQFHYAPRGSEGYRVADPFELLYFDLSVVQPALQLAEAGDAAIWSEAQYRRLDQINEAAAPFGYEIVLYRHTATDEHYFIFEESDDPAIRRHWGIHVLKLGEAAPFVVEVPLPMQEQNTFEFGASLFQSLNARALLISASHSEANGDGSTVLTSSQNRHSLFNLFHQSVLRSEQRNNPMAIQIRGFTPEPGESARELYVARFDYQKPGAAANQALLDLQAHLQQRGLVLAEPDSARYNARFLARMNGQSRFTRYVPQAQYAEVWLPAKVRSQLVRQSDSNALAKKLTALQWPLHQVDVKQWLNEHPLVVGDSSLLTQWQHQIGDFYQSYNIARLAQLDVPSAPQLLWDLNSQQYFLAFVDNRQRPILVANLAPGNHEVGDRVELFVDNRQAFLVKQAVREVQP